MTTDHHDATVHVERFDHRGGPVFYASLPCSTDRFKSQWTDRSEEKIRLISRLWDHLVATEDPIWKCVDSSRSAAFPLHVAHGPLGKPHLLLGDYRGPAISFSEGGGNVWAALCGDPSDIGIDVAGTDEFQTDYPFHRVFNNPELHHALCLAEGELGSASALLWSIKEAVVKALGGAFHLVDPLQINVYPPVAEENAGYAFPVRLSGKALMRFLKVRDRSILVRSFPLAKMWLSITLLNRQPERI